jgi:hypothetical protein
MLSRLRTPLSCTAVGAPNRAALGVAPLFRAFSSAPRHTPTGKVVSLDYNDLVANRDLSEPLYEAYGPMGLGALTVRNIPGYVEQRKQLLPLAHKLAHLPPHELQKLEHAESMFNVGWSHGKEKMGNTPDFAKGSFYGNPLFDNAVSEEVRSFASPFHPRTLTSPSFPPYPLYSFSRSLPLIRARHCRAADRCAKSIPTSSPATFGPTLLCPPSNRASRPWAERCTTSGIHCAPSFFEAFFFQYLKQCFLFFCVFLWCCTLCSVLLCRQIDRLTASRIPSYTPNLMYDQFRATKKIKGRLLYYFPVEKKVQSEDGWIGWHNGQQLLPSTCLLLVDVQHSHLLFCCAWSLA